METLVRVTVVHHFYLYVTSGTIYASRAALSIRHERQYVHVTSGDNPALEGRLRWGRMWHVGELVEGCILLFTLFLVKDSNIRTRGSPRSVGQFVSTLVGGVAISRGVNRLGLPIANSVAAKRTGDDSVTKGVGQNRMNKLFGLGKMRGVHSMRGLTMRGSQLNVPLLFNVSIVRKCRAVFPVPLNLSYA